MPTPSDYSTIASADAIAAAQASDAFDFARCSFALSDGEMRITAQVMAAERARMAEM